MNAVRGEVGIEIGGRQRVLVCDMNAAEALFQSVGAHWLLWLYERFIGKADKLPDGTKIRRMEALSPKELATALHGLLANDRIGSGKEETADELFLSMNPFATHELQIAASKAVLASVGVPGEAVEAEPDAAAEPPGSEPAAMPGTGRPR